MRPLELFYTQKRTNMNPRKEVVLDLVANAPAKVGFLLEHCSEIGLSSQATTHREIHELVQDGFLSYRIPAADRRVALVKITRKGQRYLEAL